MEAFKIKLKEVVSKKEKVKLLDSSDLRKKQWDECVDLAKAAVRNYKEARIVIADLAIKACHIHHGGRPRHDFFTVKKFAKEIGLPYTTVSNWISTRMHIKSIKDKDVKAYATEHFGLINKNIKTSGDVEAQVKTIMKSKPGHFKWKKYLSHLKSINFNSKHDSAMKEANKKDLLEILHLSREVAFNIAKFLKD